MPPAFRIGPASPTQRDPDDDRPQQVPEFPDFFFEWPDLSALGSSPASSADPFTQGIVGTARSAAEAVTGRPPQQVAPTPSGPPPDDHGFLEFVSSRFKKGVALLTAGVGQLTSDLGEAGFGVANVDVIKRNAQRLASGQDPIGAEEANQIAALQGQLVFREAMQRAQELHMEPEGAVEYIVGTTAEMLPLVAVAAAGGFTKLGAKIPGFITSYGAEKAGMRVELESEGVDPDRAEAIATAAAVPIAALESAFEVGIAGRFADRVAGHVTNAVSDGVKKNVARIFADVGRRAAAGAFFEGSTEALQEGVIMGTTALSTGELGAPGPEAFARLAESFLAGATGGAVFGGAFELAGVGAEAARRENARYVEEKLQTARVAAALNFDPAAAPSGTIIGNKRKLQPDARGRSYWIDEAGKRTSAPSPEEVQAHLLGDLRNAQARSDVALATDDSTPLDIPVASAAARLAQAANDPSITPEVAELNIRSLALNYNAEVRNESLTGSEAEAESAMYEAIALDTSNNLSYGARLRLLARKRAVDYQQRRASRAANAVENLDVSAEASRVAQLDGETFETLAADAETSQNPIQQRVFREARQLRSAKLIKEGKEEAREAIANARTARARGLTEGSRVAEGAVPGTVKEVRPSGFVRVQFDGQEETTLMDPGTLNIIPQPKQKVELVGGEVAAVLEISDDNKLLIRLQNGNQTVVEVGEIESISDSPEAAAAIDEKEAKQETVAEPRKQKIGRSVSATSKKTGKKVSITAVGETTVETSEGEEAARSDLSFTSTDARLIPEIRATGEIPTFEPGTQPSASGRHINFLQIPGSQVKAFEAHVLNADPSVSATGIINTFGRLTLIPQPNRAGEVTYAIEMPADARELTDAGKKLLGHLAGKKTGVTKQTLRAAVKINRPLRVEEVGIMRVPEALAALAQPNTDVEYLRRLVDFGFEPLTPEITQALEEASQASHTATQARIAGDIGLAEVEEINAQVKTVEASQLAIEQDNEIRRTIWEAIETELRLALGEYTPEDVEVLNAVTAEELMTVPGVSRKLAESIITRRTELGGFKKVTDFETAKGVGPKRAAPIYQHLREGLLSARQRASKNTNNLRILLQNFPGRRGDRSLVSPMAFAHPTVPGLSLVVDKETISSFDTDTREVVDRDIYNIEFILPDGRVANARRLTTNTTASVLVPQSTMRTERTVVVDPKSKRREVRESLPAAVRRINEGLLAGEPLSDVLLELEGQQRQIRLVRLAPKSDHPLAAGQTVEVLEEDPENGILTVQTLRARPREHDPAFDRPDEATIAEPADTSEPEVFQIRMAQVVEDLGTVEEPMVEVAVPTRLSPDQVLDEVIREISRFNRVAGQLSTGEWISSTPGVYAEIRPVEIAGKQYFDARIMKHPLARRRRQVVVFEPVQNKLAKTRADAEKWLKGQGFRKNPGVPHSALVAFGELPPAASAPLVSTEKLLSRILDFYHSRGYIPPRLRQYSIEFAQRWAKEAPPALRSREGKPGGLYDSSAVRRRLGIYNARDLTRSTQKRHLETQTLPLPDEVEIENGNVVVGRTSAAQRSEDVRIFDGLLLDDSVPATDPAKMEQAKALYEQAEHRERFLDLVDTDGDPTLFDIARRLVRVDGRLGVIIHSRPGENSLTVQVMVEGKPVIKTVSKSDAKRVRSYDKAQDYYRSARDALGEISEWPRTPDIGASPLDARLGLDGIVDRKEYIAGLGKKITQLRRRVKVVEKAGTPTKGAETRQVAIKSTANLTGDTDLIEVFRDAYIRMAELGITNEDFPDSRQGIPPVMIPMLKQLSYEELRNTYSTISPYGDLVAKAKLGLVSRKKLKQIDAQAKHYGIDMSLPTYRKVEELIAHAWDPTAAHYLFQLSREAGFLRFSRDANIPDHGIEIRMPSGGSAIRFNAANIWFMTPREAANRHPAIRVFHHLSEKARTLHGNFVKRGRDIIDGLQSVGVGMDLEKKQFIWSLLENEKLGALMKSPSEILSRAEILAELGSMPQWDWYHQYSTLRSVMVEVRRLAFRNAMVSGFHPEPINLGADNLPDDKVAMYELLKKDYGLSQAEVQLAEQRFAEGRPFYHLDRTRNPAYARPRDEVARMLDLLDQYKSYVDIPEYIQAEMVKSQEAWMADEFDFWAGFGMTNYAPHVLQGRHRIYKKSTVEGEPDELIGMAPDAMSYYQFIQRVRAGRIPGVARDGEFYVQMGKAIADDLDMEFLGVDRFKKFYAEIASKYGGRDGLGADIARTAVRALNLGKEKAVPRDLHQQARESELASAIEDPYLRILLYLARTSRNNFLLEVSHANQTAKDLDGVMSRAEGVERFQRNAAAAKYVEMLKDSYMGIPTWVDRMTNRILAVVSAVASLGPRKARILLKFKNDPNYVLWDDPEFMEHLYNEDYTARRWAENATVLQSVWRLGFNLGGAAINATQHLMHTPAYLVTRGVGVDKAWAHALGGMRDAVTYAKAVRTPEADRTEEQIALIDFVRDAGTVVVPARGIAGPGLGITGEAPPIYFSDDGMMERAGKFVEWAAMLPFAKAERSVRLSATFAGKRAAEAGGMKGEEAINFAREVVDNTQFQYYDQALPPYMRGPGARILFQFQQFPMNAIKYEKDMMLASLNMGRFKGQKISYGGESIDAKDAAYKAWLLYHIGGLVMGGGAWMAARPAAAALAPIAKLMGFTNFEEMFMHLWGSAEDEEREHYGTYVGDPELLEARNFALYGLPGLAGLNISARLGVSGLDMNANRLRDVILGPTGSMYADWASVFKGTEFDPGLISQNPREALFLGVGSVAFSRAMGRLAPIPVGAFITDTFFDTMVSPVMGKDQLSTFHNTTVGRRFLQSISNPLWRGIYHTIDIFEDGGTTEDANFVEHRYSGFSNQLFEATSGILNLQTIRESEERTLSQYRLRHMESLAKKKRGFVEDAAGARSRGDEQRVLEIIAQASEEYGIKIDGSDIQRELERRRTGILEGVDARLPILLRLETTSGSK